MEKYQNKTHNELQRLESEGMNWTLEIKWERAFK